MTALRDNNGKFIKGNTGFWLGKKRPNLCNTNAANTMYKKGIRNNPNGEFKKKGKEYSYHGLHRWVERTLGFSRNGFCKWCGDVENLNWANVSHEYKQDVLDWMILCRKCHVKYDRQMGWGDATRRYGL